jgi:hypothetical protein
MSGDPDAIGVLEPGQLAAAKAGVLPRRTLGWGVVALLVLLRAYVFIAVPIVGYAFVHAILAAR